MYLFGGVFIFVGSRLSRGFRWAFTCFIGRMTAFHSYWLLLLCFFEKQVRIHESTVACDWAGAVMPENHEKSEVISDRPTDRPTDRHSEL